MRAPIAAVPLRRPEETARELSELREAATDPIAPEDYERYRQRAHQLRAEAMQHLIAAAITAMRSGRERLFERDSGGALEADPCLRSS